MHPHLFERVCSLENLLAASREALKNGKRAKPPGRVFSRWKSRWCGCAASCWRGRTGTAATPISLFIAVRGFRSVTPG